MLTGSATPFLHNGIMTVEYNEENNFDYGEGKVGITNRNDIGFLFWDTNPKLTQEAGLGSRLKTPVLPIWVTCVNGNWGVLFNPNKDLMKSYAAENRSFIQNTHLWHGSKAQTLCYSGSTCTTSATRPSRRRGTPSSWSTPGTQSERRSMLSSMMTLMLSRKIPWKRPYSQSK